MSSDHLISTANQLQSGIEDLMIRGLRTIDSEQQNWLRHTRDNLRETGAEFLAQKMDNLLTAIDAKPKDAPRKLLDLLTTLRVFNRVATLDSAVHKLGWLCAAPESEDDDDGNGDDVAGDEEA